MSQKHSRILHAILQGPAGGNIHWRDIESLLRHLGADIQAGHGARMRIILNGVEGTLHRPHHSSTYSKQDIHHLRDYLISAGMDMSALNNE
ncbi:type II toxin-antitoxin system HicA family toxin [endosymbiont of Lamellibrachia barhami]|uniref:type II toxin-antitoxin system HicA family toxin n=1 Tax=endosymbiont of Lamellibrachia barhami TaxID=205975 RepID=UPI0015AE7A20|nr:type II toxin-antitoxin system HicA family toxin [endosymbiont of Lamellibrachia barhami]